MTGPRLLGLELRTLSFSGSSGGALAVDGEISLDFAWLDTHVLGLTMWSGWGLGGIEVSVVVGLGDAESEKEYD